MPLDGTGVDAEVLVVIGQGMAEAVERKLFDTVCVRFVRDAVEIAERL